MGKSLGVAILYAVGALLAAGCASSPWSARRSVSTEAVVPRSVGASTPEAAPPQPHAASEAQPMQEVMAELQQLGALDPAAQEKLMEDLRHTDPSLWPLLLQQFRAAVAYRRQAQQRDGAGSAGGQFASTAGAVASAMPTRSFAGRPQQSFPPNTRLAPHQTQQAPLGGPNNVNGFGQPPPVDAAAVRQQGALAGHLGTVPGMSDRHRSDRRPIDPATGVTNVSYDSGDWRSHVASAARVLESQTQYAPETEQDIARLARLRLLYLLADQRDAAVRPIPSVKPATSEFWSQELFGLATWLDTERTPDASTRAAEAQRILGEALAHLGESAPLVVRNLAFCTHTQSYGCIEPFKKYEFVPEQEVLLYAEVENFTSEPTPKGFHTSLRSSYRIFDVRGQQVAQQDFKPTDDYCQNRRRDFFISYRFPLPKRIYPGKHTLRLEIEDTKSRKFGQTSIELTIVGDDG